MTDNNMLKIQYNQTTCKNTSQILHGITLPSFKAKLPKNTENQISDETLKLASAAIAASGIVYIGSGKQKSTLSHEQQEEIIEKFKQGKNYREIAEEYGCSEKPIRNVIKAQNNREELIVINKAARKKLSTTQEIEIIEKYKQGMSYVEIANEYKEFGAYKELIADIILNQPNIGEIRDIHDENKSFFTTKQKQEIVEKYRQGSSYEKLAGEYGCSVRCIQTVIGKREDLEELKQQSNESRLKITPEQGPIMLQRYANGEALHAITKDICSEELFRIYINRQPNADELNQQHEANKGFFRPEVKQQIIERFINGESCQTIANDLKCDYGTVRDFIKDLPNSEELIKQNEENNKPFSSEEQTIIINGLVNGMSFSAIARKIKRDRQAVASFISNLPNSTELLIQNTNNRKHTRKYKFEEDEITDIVQRFLGGESFVSISSDYDCSDRTISQIIKAQLNAETIKSVIEKRKQTYTPEQITYIIDKFKNGESYTTIAQDKYVHKSPSTVRYIIFLQDNVEDLLLQHNKNAYNKTLKAKQEDIVKSYRAGKTYREIAQEFDCTIPILRIILNEQPDIEDILAEHKRNSVFFDENQIQDILQRKVNGDSNEKIARRYNCSSSVIWKIIQQEFNKNKEGTTRETYSHKYEEYSIDELKTRISEYISLKQVEENDELLEIMFYLDKKTKFDDDEKFVCIKFMRLLDKLEQQKLSTKNIKESQEVKHLFDLIARDVARQQIFEELKKDYLVTINELNLIGDNALGNICSKYIANNINDENNVASMKAILNIISSNDETRMRHKLVAYDYIKQNPNNFTIQKAQESYGKNSQEKIGQYIIFEQCLNGDFSYANFNNDALKFIDELKNIGLSKEAIIKRLIELEDYFNSQEAENNSLTNFVNKFNYRNNYISRKIVDFYIDNIYKDKITTYELQPNNKIFSRPAIIKIYPEAKKRVLNYKCNWDLHEFLIDSDKYAQNYAERGTRAMGIKLFKLKEQYEEDGFKAGDNIVEIKVPPKYDGSRLVAVKKDKEDNVFEIRYFKPKGFHEEQ